MEESFLHYIWQFQYFDKTALRTVQDEVLEIFTPGFHNTHAGPDFGLARINIDGINWVGSVEIHTSSSFWLAHHHDQDEAYENVVLHVVWENDQPISRPDGSALPTLVLKDRIDEGLIKKYRKLVGDTAFIPCGKSLHRVEEVVKHSMMDLALIERLDQRSKSILAELKKNNNDWQQTSYSWLAQHFGFKVNNFPFAQLSKNLPLRILLKHADQLVQVEALLFGQAGFLDVSVGDEYYQLLQREYLMLSRKYKLTSAKMKRSQWRFLRMRPANFPTLRLAQLASIIVLRKTLFTDVLTEGDYSKLKSALWVPTSAYWHHHYRFNVPSKQALEGLGDSGLEILLINAVAPLLVAYGAYSGSPGIDKALALLYKIRPENNSIIRLWGDQKVYAQHAFDSQGLLELYNSYCLKRKCLNCKIGASHLKPN